MVSKAEIEAAFDFLDIERRGMVSLSNVRNRMGAFYGSLPMKEYKLLLGDKTELTVEDLYEILSDSVVSNFDPVLEAFKVYDPENRGYIDVELLRSIYTKLGLGDLTSEDLDILVKNADFDGDGVIGLEDFRQLSLLIPEPVDMGRLIRGEDEEAGDDHEEKD